MDAVEICLGNEAGGRIAVVFDGSQASRLALQHAIAVARQRHGRLTVIGIAPKPWFTVGMGGICPGICPARLEQEMIEYTERALCQAVALIPDDLPCTTVLRRGAAKREYRKVLREREHDTLVTVPPKTRRMRRTRWLQLAPRAV
jgi:nucleotide-binding universal stress UspA family protein